MAGKDFDSPVYPMRVYLYNPEGFYREPIYIDTKEDLEAAFRQHIVPHVKQKLQVRITDPGDLLLFHAYNGCIKWNGEEKHECPNCIEKEIERDH